MSAQYDLTEARRAAAITNAQRSTGPVSDEGKARSSLNAMTHGGCSRAPLLPGEDPAEYEAELRAWGDDLKPCGQAETRLLLHIVAASRALRRCEQHEADAAHVRVTQTLDEFESREAEDADSWIDEFEERPMVALAHLKTSVAGCRWALARWDQIRTVAAARDGFDSTRVLQALRLSGLRPEEFSDDPDGVELVRLMLALTQLRAASVEAVAKALASAWPERLDQSGRLHRTRLMLAELPTPDAAREALLSRIDGERADWKMRLTRLEADAPARTERLASAALFDDTKAGALRLRYYTAHRNALQGFLRELRMRQEARVKEASKSIAPAASPQFQTTEIRRQGLEESVAAPETALRNEPRTTGSGPEAASEHVDVIPLAGASHRTDRGAGGAFGAR